MYPVPPDGKLPLRLDTLRIRTLDIDPQLLHEVAVACPPPVDSRLTSTPIVISSTTMTPRLIQRPSWADEGGHSRVCGFAYATR